MADLTAQIRAQLQCQSLPLPSQAWLQSLIAARTPPPPLQSLVATARARLLAADLTTAGLLDSSTASLPANISNAEVAEARLPRDVVVQVLDVENLTRSRWEQVEELEAIERGEQTRGRQIIRLPTGNEDEDEDQGVAAAAAAESQEPAPRATARSAPVGKGPKNATHRLVLQDWKGQRVYGLELKTVEKIGVGITSIGEKILLRAGTVVARGTMLLQPATTSVLGGKVELWQKTWVDGRLAKLKEAIGSDRPL